MKIDSALVGMESARNYQSFRKTSARFVIRDYQKEKEEKGADVETGEEEKKSSDVKLHKDRLSAGGVNPVKREREHTETEIRQMTLRYIFQMLFAKRKGELAKWKQENEPNLVNPLAEAPKTGLYLSRQTEVYEEENLSFQTRGVVTTSDGRTIDFGINLQMSRSFQATFSEEIRMNAKNLCDPIVLNLDTDATTLSDQTFLFDLDADGTEDRIAALGPGSGFLALDQNGNGRIDDGNELFGTKSGNGFADLAAYDEDGNGWIDENDAVFDLLKVWYRDSSGKDVLVSLKEAGVGALSLMNAETNYNLKDSSNELQGVIRRTGFFLYENGGAGTMMHVDLARA